VPEYKSASRDLIDTMPNSGRPQVHEPGLLHRPLAIIGLACRLPGADGLEQFWQLLSSGSSAIERVPDSKLDRSLYFYPDKGQRGKTYSEIGGFISSRELDWSLLPIPPSEAQAWDPCHLILCETVAAACRHAGWDPRNLPHRNGAVEVGGQRLNVPLQAGSIRGFEYDWRKHKVPPKQIAQANPLQFLLLDAAEQALPLATEPTAFFADHNALVL
jgi:Beta-ketoacyl synthase, N-terminal domain